MPAGERERCCRATALLLVAGALWGCPHRPPPLDFGPRGRLADAAAAFEALQARLDRVRTVNGEARAAVHAPEGAGKLKVFAAAQAPDRLRLETMSFFGSPAAVLASDGTTLTLHDVERGAFWRGPATAAGVALLLPVRVEPAELVALLLGGPPLLEDAEPVALELDEAARAYVLSLRADPDVERVWLDTATLRPVRVEMPARGAVAGFTAEFADYDGELPGSVALRAADGERRVKLVWGDRQVNEPVDEKLFRLEPPAGATVRELAP